MRFISTRATWQILYFLSSLGAYFIMISSFIRDLTLRPGCNNQEGSFSPNRILLLQALPNRMHHYSPESLLILAPGAITIDDCVVVKGKYVLAATECPMVISTSWYFCTEPKGLKKDSSAHRDAGSLADRTNSHVHSRPYCGTRLINLSYSTGFIWPGSIASVIRGSGLIDWFLPGDQLSGSSI